MSFLRFRLLLITAIVSLAAPGTRATTEVTDEHASRASRALTPIFEFRLRSEGVEQEGMPEDAEAVTLRGRFGFETARTRSTSLLAEAELLWPLATRYDSTVNGETKFPIVLDPETYEINRLQLVNASVPDTRVVLGRQRIAVDDHRFVGNVGWRQNEQTFDALRITNDSLAHLSVDVMYLNQVNRIPGKDSLLGRYHGDSYLADVAYQVPAGRLTGFAYLLDFDEAPADSSRTVGLRFVGNRAIEAIGLAYRIAYARQRDRAANPFDFEAEWYSLDLTGTYRHVNVGSGREVLTGDGAKGFSTPLATLHAFQGWADKFLTTPPDGIDDRYVTVGYVKQDFRRIEKLSVVAAYHVFQAERLALDYGTELDLQVRAEWKRVRAALKYADYGTRGFASDTTKLWAEVELVW